MRIVVKVGTSTLAHPTGRLNIQRMERLCKVLSDLKNAGHEIILVSSGAIGMGVGKLSLPSKPSDMPTKQAAGSRKRNFHNTLARLLELGALPVINENDTVSTDEIVIGDNDTLSANVASTIDADLLVLLSDIDGLYDSDPQKNPSARLIDTVEQLDERIYALAGGEGSSLGTGGMVTKLRAAKIATDAGCEMVIANGSRPENLYDILDGAHVGTRFLTQEEGK